MLTVHLTASAFFGGPERQMLDLAKAMPADYRTAFLLFRERGGSLDFQQRLDESGFESHILDHDTPRLPGMIGEVATRLRGMSADVLCPHGYKAHIVGLLAARRAGIPVVAVCRGWTSDTWKLRVYEAIDRTCLRKMDRVVCVSEGQAVKIQVAGVRPERVRVIRNAIRPERFAAGDPSARANLIGLFDSPPVRIVGAAGRLSPEKGFDVLVEAAAIVRRSNPEIGYIHFGEGRLRERLERRIKQLGIDDRFLLTGFRTDLDRLIPALDLVVIPSFTEGLPNVALEAYASAVPVVGTAVGGVPEVIEHGVSGFLVPAGNPGALARGILEVLSSEDRRRSMGERGRYRIERHFTFAAQAAQYRQLFKEVTSHECRKGHSTTTSDRSRMIARSTQPGQK
jgi:glycosyltransferase involved in cell wall biosynthesis